MEDNEEILNDGEAGTSLLSGNKIDMEDNGENSNDEAGTPPPLPSINTRRIPPDIKLPETVTRLDAPNGNSIFVVGTAHFSKESQDDVTNTIREIRPDVVVVELCRARTAILSLDEETILEQTKNFNLAKVRDILRQHGTFQGILYLLLLSVSAHITKQLGMAPGGEFRSAFQEAQLCIPGAKIMLGDRPIHITLARALASLNVWQKIKLACHILLNKDPISKEEVEKCKQNDFIEEALAEMTGHFPGTIKVFVNERDIYLTRSLQHAIGYIPEEPDQKDTPSRIAVGVVGFGHIAGIKENWGKVTAKDINPILIIPPPSITDRLLKSTIKLSFYGLAGFVVYKCLPRTIKTYIGSSMSNAITHANSYISKVPGLNTT